MLHEDIIFGLYGILSPEIGITASERVIAPIIWYINTGRASAQFMKILARKDNLLKAAVILNKHNGFSDYHEVLAEIKDAIGYDHDPSRKTVPALDYYRVGAR